MVVSSLYFKPGARLISYIVSMQTSVCVCLCVRPQPINK